MRARTFGFAGRRGALIVAPAWTTSGSFEVFKAQCRVLKDLGYSVCFVAVTHHWHGPEWFAKSVADYTEHWDTLDADVRCIAAYPPDAEQKAKQFDAKHGSDSEAIKDTKGAQLLQLPWRAIWFAIRHRRLLVVCNHCFNVPFLERISRRAGRRLRFVLETHDIQANQSLLRNARLTEEDRELALRDELETCRKAAQIVNISASDHAFFREHLPGVKNTLVYPFIAKNQTAGNGRADFAFLIVSSWSHPNARSLDWFLTKVWARYRGPANLVIVGNIDHAMRQIYPDTYELWKTLFVGRVADIAPYYHAAAIVLMPIVAGEGIAIKFAEAMAFEKRVLISPLALRGLPEDVVAPLRDCVCRDEDAFLSKLDTAERIDRVESDARSAAIYGQLFSWPTYRSLYGEIAARNEN